MANAKKHASSDAAAKRKLAQASSGLAFARGKNLSLKQLKQTADFAAYARLLKAFAKRYTVMAVACDTPCGPDFVKEHSLLMQDIGFTKDLCGKYRHGYAALIDAAAASGDMWPIDSPEVPPEKRPSVSSAHSLSMCILLRYEVG